MQWSVFHLQCVSTILNGLSVPPMCNAISLPPSAIYRPLNDVDFEKRLTMSKIVKDRIVRDENFGELRLDRDQINKLYNISLEYINGEYTTEQLIDRILKI